MQHDVIERVLKVAGQRETPPAEVERAVRESLRHEWLAVVAFERERLRRRRVRILAAGVAAAAIGVWLAASQLVGRAETVATVAAVSNHLSAQAGWLRSPHDVREGQVLTAGQTILTDDTGRGSLTLARGISARLDRGTRIRLAAPNQIVIERGALYVDAGTSPSAAHSLDVVTPAGVVSHVGTQYEVRLTDAGVRLRVREGHIEWRSRTGWIESGRTGEQLLIAGDGRVRREAVPLYGESWDWVASSAPVIDIDGLPLVDFLAWAARELGREVAYASPAIEPEVSGIFIHGSIAGLTPAQALDAVLATTSVRAEITDGRIVVRSQETALHPTD